MYNMPSRVEENFIFDWIFMLFLNISSDKVHLLDDQNEKFLERNGIENTLWPTLLQYTQSHPVETIVLLNGPGGFTNLRVGTLTLNMLNELLEHDTGTFIPIASISKFDLYTYAYKQWRIPRHGIIYIGQKHNVWKYDCEQKTHQQITLEDIQYSDQIFIDFVHDTYRKSTDEMISFSMDNNTLYLHYRGNSHEIVMTDLDIPLTMSVAPEYFIQPTLN